MTLLKMKKENLITVAGVVWLLAGANVALIGLRSAVEMSGAPVGVVGALVVGAVLAFFAFHAMFGTIVLKNEQRIRGLDGELPAILGSQGLSDHGLHDVFRLRAASNRAHPHLVLCILLHGIGICSGTGGCKLPTAPSVW